MIIDPRIPSPAQLVNFQINPKFSHWNCLNNIVKSWFYSYVSSSMHPHMRHGATSVEQWSSLERVHWGSSNVVLQNSVFNFKQ